MARLWKPRDFDSVYERFICQEEMKFGQRDYFVRYRSRYKECMKRLAALASSRPVDVLDIGGGSLALMAAKLWNDHGVVADLPGPHLDGLAAHGVEIINWNICTSEPPFEGKFDFIFFSEVIEHLPMPGYLALRRVAKVLRPGGILICTTPNLYRLRNVVYMALGRPIFDNFQYPDTDTSLGHVLEYGRDHLDWQFKQSGFAQYSVEYCQFHHIPTNPLHRPLAILGYPLHMVPRWRDYLIATAYAPPRPDSENRTADRMDFSATEEKE
jgi:2-polyprenyl-3-methyl-5-hydroxy-6-metoxy-1,4-benzoquinol methylase